MKKVAIRAAAVVPKTIMSISELKKQKEQRREFNEKSEKKEEKLSNRIFKLRTK